MKNNKEEGPKFHPSVKVPEVPKDKVLVKFHGQPALLSKPNPEDRRFGNSNFTERQVTELMMLEETRRKIITETGELTKGLDPTDPSTQALKDAIAIRPYSATEQIPVNGVLLKPGVPVEVEPAVQLQ